MDKLSLPVINARISQIDDKPYIFDIVRKKNILLTPEEWVRQHFVHYLIDGLGYPKPLIKVEQGLRYHSLLKRSDIIVFDRSGVPLVLVECKAPEIPLNQKVVEQAMMYNKTIMAPYIIITNGIEHSCLYINREDSKIDFLPELPRFEKIIK